MNRFLSMLAVASAALAAGVFAPGTSRIVAAATAPPSPPPPPLRNVPAPGPTGAIATSTPAAAISIPIAPGAHPAGQPSAPPEDGRKGLEGVWEVAIQTPDGDTKYDHFKLVQKGSVLTGSYLDNQHNNKKYPVAGSLDGKTFHLVVTKDDGTTITLSAQVDGTSDMVGMMQEGSNQVAFTAAYRPKYRFLDDISPGVPGGLGSGGNSGGGSGYPPRR
ncbi:MAG: hypothetical protein GIW97_02925 [Candidatus Eremiobacteraeota bacterium]|nr:hypothetical protein [Candidatus Eremiobacteraeota bacterium]